MVGVLAVPVQRDPAGVGSLYRWDLELLPDGGTERDFPNPLLGSGNGQGGNKRQGEQKGSGVCVLVELGQNQTEIGVRTRYPNPPPDPLRRI